MKKNGKTAETLKQSVLSVRDSCGDATGDGDQMVIV